MAGGRLVAAARLHADVAILDDCRAGPIAVRPASSLKLRENPYGVRTFFSIDGDRITFLVLDW